jgi:hypothetical protein
VTEIAFTAGIVRLQALYGVELTKAQLHVYREALGDLTDEEFTGGCKAVEAHWVPAFGVKFPAPGLIRRYALPHRNRASEAGELFDQIRMAGEWAPTGSRWTVGTIGEEFGPLAAEAFHAAGGSGAFAGEQDERSLPFLRKRFCDAYQASAEAMDRGEPILALPISRKRLPAPVNALVDGITARGAVADGPTAKQLDEKRRDFKSLATGESTR